MSSDIKQDIMLSRNRRHKTLVGSQRRPLNESKQKNIHVALFVRWVQVIDRGDFDDS